MRRQHCLRIHLDHAATGDGRRRGLGQVVDLEHHREKVSHVYNLGVGQAEFLAVVEAGVHALDPERVNWSVK